MLGIDNLSTFHHAPTDVIYSTSQIIQSNMRQMLQNMQHYEITLITDCLSREFFFKPSENEIIFWLLGYCAQFENN